VADASNPAASNSHQRTSAPTTGTRIGGHRLNRVHLEPNKKGRPESRPLSLAIDDPTSESASAGFP
jgi:hypothetical protein